MTLAKLHIWQNTQFCSRNVCKTRVFIFEQMAHHSHFSQLSILVRAIIFGFLQKPWKAYTTKLEEQIVACKFLQIEKIAIANEEMF